MEKRHLARLLQATKEQRAETVCPRGDPVELNELSIPGCHSPCPAVRGGAGAVLVKTIVEASLLRAGLRVDFKEHYYSVSCREVIRGTDFQVPPHDYDKAVFCLCGKALDVVVDLRTGSPTYGRPLVITLEGRDVRGTYVPRGCAPGFLADDTILMYHVTSEYAPQSDLGIRWDRIPFDWPTRNPVISERDGGLPALSAFRSPFSFEERG